MKNNALLTSPTLTALLLALAFSSSVRGRSLPVVREDSLCRDSVYRRVIRQGSTSLSCYLSYPQGVSSVLRGYGNNAYELGKLGEFIRTALSDTLIYVRNVRVCGYCSVDGNYASNEQLARKRSLGFRDFLFQEYPFLKQYGITAGWIGEDWDRLRGLVAASDLNERDEILQIIDKVDVFSGREKLLMDLNGGSAYRNMEKHFFPLLRRVELTVEYDLRRMIEERYRRKLSEEEFLVLLEREREQSRMVQNRLKKELEELKVLRAADSVACARIAALGAVEYKVSTALSDKPVTTRKRPWLGISTNLYSLCGFTTEGERTALMPNLEIECFIFSRWSVAASVLYSYLDFGQNEFWGVSSYTVEPRFWLSGSNTYRGLYLGFYLRAGDFDIRRNATDGVTADNGTGIYYEGGCSGGYILPLSHRWMLRAGVSAGYRSVREKRYEIDQDSHYFLDRKTGGNFSLTEISLSIGFRLGTRKEAKHE